MDKNKKRIAISLILSLIFLAVVFSRVPIREVVAVLGRVQFFWLGIAIAVLAGTITLAGARWDQVLRSQNLRLSFFQVIRASWYGHFFNTLLLGPVAGDVLKSTLFAREQNRTIVEFLSTSWLDRLMAGIASLFFAGFIVIFTLAMGHEMNISLPALNPWMVAGGIIGFVLVCGIVWKLKLLDKISFIKKLKDSFVLAVCKMYNAPARAILIVAMGFVGQILLSSILAWTLAAVLTIEVPWIKMLWVFPAIAILTSLPISVGGLGVREGASLVLLGRYGVSEPDAVAASLLCLCVYWLMAAVGGVLILVGAPKTIKK